MNDKAWAHTWIISKVKLKNNKSKINGCITTILQTAPAVWSHRYQFHLHSFRSAGGKLNHFSRVWSSMKTCTVQMVNQAFTKAAFLYQPGCQLMKPSGVSHGVWEYLTRYPAVSQLIGCVFKIGCAHWWFWHPFMEFFTELSAATAKVNGANLPFFG